MPMASASTTWTGWLLSAGVRQRPSKTGSVVTQFVTQPSPGASSTTPPACRLSVAMRKSPHVAKSKSSLVAS